MNDAHGWRRPHTRLLLAALPAALALTVSACGGGTSDNGGAKKVEQQPASMQVGGAIEHLTDAKQALTQGRLTGPESVADHLAEALAVPGISADVREHAQEALASVKAGNREQAQEHIADALSAGARVAPVKATGSVGVTLGEFFVRLDGSTVKAGAVRIEARNSGNVEHELVIVKTDRPEAKLPVVGAKVDEQRAGEEIGEIEEFAPGKTEATTVKLEPGRYVLFCNLPGHYRAGQHTTLTAR